MKDTQSFRTFLVVAVVTVTLGAGRAAWSQGDPSVPVARRGSVLSMAKFYTGVVGTQGKFPGKLVCLRCDLKPCDMSTKLCAEEGHRHALSMREGSMIHPLLAGTEKVLERVNSAELHGKNVTVDGTYYPSTGAILVGQITVEEQ